MSAVRAAGPVVKKGAGKRKVVNAFGENSPSWNLSFPIGNLTAAEIICYGPHWLKSIDVIDRFITNGGKSYIIADMINEFRYQPDGDSAPFVPNSVCMMLQYAMRRAGAKGWTVGTHSRLANAREGQWDENSIDVTNFRTPRITHPKEKSTTLNLEAAPVQFRDLAVHVKQHPSGADALDLTKCVVYAVSHPDESWLFPNDFGALVKQLGGETPVTVAHTDKHVFARRSTNRAPAHNTDASLSGPAPQGQKRKRTMARTRGTTKTENGPQNHGLAEDTTNNAMAGTTRRSGRLADKPTVTLREDPGISDKENKDEWSINKKRKLSTADDSNSDFVQLSSSTSPTVTNADASDDSAYGPPLRRSAKKARHSITQLAQQIYPPTPPPPPPRAESPPIDPMLFDAAAAFPFKKPAYLKPPVLDRDRLVVDERSVHLYAEEGAKDLWASALSSTRFGGPRRTAPFRELYRLSDPHGMDTSDFAENIRWAKEQARFYGSTTWTEYDYHLEQITEHRHLNMWASEWLILALADPTFTPST